jgi:threonine/homoserine/homoserine lactone efflux protein
VIVHISLSVLGLSVILARSAFAFNLIRYLGAAYLVFLGVKMIFSKSSDFGKAGKPAGNAAPGKLFWQGFVTNVLNPKVGLFFLSFLPQFANPHSAYFSLNLLLLGLWFIFSGTVVTIGIALFFGKIRTRISSFNAFWKWQKKVTGTILIALGLRIAFEKNS